MRDDIEAAELRSERFIASLYRGSLGRFAFDADALKFGDMLMREDMRGEKGRRSSINDYATNNLIDYMNRPGGIKWIDVYSELVFWWERVGSPEMRKWAEEQVDGNIELQKKLDKIILVSSHPIKVHDYFAVGIWDVSFITKCIDDGIDPELARAIK